MNNKKNLQYFENKTMRGLFEDMQTWQEDNQKKPSLLSTETERRRFVCLYRSHEPNRGDARGL